MEEDPTRTLPNTSNPNLATNPNPTIVATPITNEVKGEGDKNVVEGKSKKSMVWDHFTKLHLAETKGEHKANAIIVV
ncbi:hypothetical protein SESBI_49594 [Sesbania bispinosa]|nr:hypothetical protein SESBI_49594 [Sesbania bispinosa]